MTLKVKSLYLVYDGGEVVALTEEQVTQAAEMGQSPKWAMGITGRPNLSEREYVIVLADDAAAALRLAAAYDAGAIQPDNKQTQYGSIVCLV